MEISSIYTCSCCKKEFRDRGECERHESICKKLVTAIEHRLTILMPLQVCTFVSFQRDKWLEDSPLLNKPQVSTYCGSVEFIMMAPESRPAVEVKKALLDFAIDWMNKLNDALKKERSKDEK